MLLIDTKGKAAVVSTAAEWQLLGTSDLKARCYATPALADSQAYFRGERHLYCFREIP